MSRRCLPGLGLTVLLVLNGCGEETATGVGDDLFPIEPQTLEIILPWSEFGADFQVFGGFGRVSDLPSATVAHRYQGVVDARILSRFGTYPRSVQARDTVDDVIRTDTLYSFLGGRLVARFDTAGREEPVDFAVHLPPRGWDARSATWTAAVDTIGVLVPWEEEGAGPALLAGEGSFLPRESDSLIVELDSATVDALGDTTALPGGIRLDVTTEDSWLTLLDLDLEVDVVPSFRQDTVVTFTAAARNLTFVYQPPPDAPEGELRIGGAPAWRSTLRFDLPRVLDGPPSLCEEVGCPFELDPTRLNAAALTLTSRTVSAGFQPRDSVRVDARAVLAPDRLPKAPLGGSYLGGVGLAVGPGAFGDPAGTEVVVPITSFVRDLARGETLAGNEPPDVLALLVAGEPSALTLASFIAPGEPGEPSLRMVLTTFDTVQIR